MQHALTALKSGHPPAGLNFNELTETVGFNAYYHDEEKYKTD
jgi:hypothetical protein